MATTLKQKAQFVTELAGKADAFAKALDAREARNRKLDELVGSGLDADRDQLRKDMTFSVQRKDGKGEVQSMDERGQRQSIESEDARSKYDSLDPKTATRVTKALEKILAIKQKMIDAKDANGEPMFTQQDVIRELFTPLVREGLIPENLVVDGDSAVAQALREIVASYKQMLKDEDAKKKLAAGKSEADINNAGTKMDRVRALGTKASNFAEAQVGALAQKTGMTPEEFKRAAAITGKTLSTANAIRKGVGEGIKLDQKLDDPKAGDVTQSMTQKLEGTTTGDLLVSPKIAEWAEKLKIDSGPLAAVMDEVRKGLNKLGASLDELIEKAGPDVLKVLTKFAKLIESDGVGIASDVVGLLATGVIGGIDIGGKGAERYDAGDKLDVAVRTAGMRSEVGSLINASAQALRNAVLAQVGKKTPPDPAFDKLLLSASQAIDGGLRSRLTEGALMDLLTPAVMTKPDKPVQEKSLLTLVAGALAGAVAACHADLKGVGDTLAEKFSSGADGKLAKVLQKGPIEDANGSLTPLAEAVAKAAAEVFGDKAFLDKLGGDAVKQGIEQEAKKANAVQEAELEMANEEIEDFERQLVLIDEGGMELARQQSLDQLIAQVKADQLDLEIVLKAGSLLSGVGGGITTLGTDAHNVRTGSSLIGQSTGQASKTVATQAAQSILPALQAAELVMKMSVTIVKIARRAELLRKFKADVDKAHKAGSLLLPSIQNFYSAKVNQQIYASIELALQTVQLAGAICSSVPEPITMAVGRALSAASSAAESARDLAKTVHDEASLRKGWKLTLQAMNNPANRRAGLDALRHNATLAVHSIAWAATNGDPMANEILRSCGVDAATMADEGSDKDKVIEYLETLLNEDLQFKDGAKVNFDWAPSPLELSYAGWFTLKQRAAKAPTPLLDEPTKEIDEALKKLSLQPKLHSIQAHAKDYSKTTLATYLLETDQVRKQLLAYKPKGQDTQPHGEMAELCRRMADLAARRHAELDEVEKSLP